ESGILRVTDAARTVADLFHHPPKQAEWRPVLTGVSRLAFATLAPELREMYGVTAGPAKRVAMSTTFAGARLLRPLLPAKYRYIAPYQEWLGRQRSRAQA
ncbi:MAG: oxygenase MpaB family protein, partial [Actinomycetota bacterium]